LLSLHRIYNIYLSLSELMTKNLYIAAAEAYSGKSLIVLGIMNILLRNLKRVGIFRPIVNISQGNDPHIELIRQHFKLPFEHHEMYGLSDEEAFEFIRKDDMDSLFSAILNKYKQLEAKCDFVLIEGTDYTGSLRPFEFDFNARVANNLGSPIIIVINGYAKSVEEIKRTIHLNKKILANEKCSYFGMFANRVKLEDKPKIENFIKQEHTDKEINIVIPELALLQKLTIRQISNALKATKIYGDDVVLDYDVDEYHIGAMSIEHVLEHTKAGALVITPGDRPDVIISLFMTYISENFPKIAGILLTGGYKPSKEIMNLITGIKKLPIAVLEVADDTYTTALKVHNIKTVLKASNERKMAAALGLFESHVEEKELTHLISFTPSKVLTPIMFEYLLFERARAHHKHIVLPEGDDERILRACEILLKRKAVDITLLGNEIEIYKKAELLQLKLTGVNIIDPFDNDLINDYSATYYKLRKEKGITKAMAVDLMQDVSYLGTMMVHKGHADGMVSGAAHTTQHTIRPAFEFIKTKPGFSIVSSSFLMCFEDKVLLYGDCALNTNPNSEELADIAISTADTALMFGIEPRIAMLSYSTGKSGKGADVDKVRQATEIAQSRRPDLKIEGPIQYDAAIDPTVAIQKMPNSEVAGKATVFIFPDLNTGNNTYKAVQRSANAVAVGPVSQGLNKPINDLSRGCTVKDIVNTVLITAIQAQENKRI